jgi:hypothetical protein
MSTRVTVDERPPVVLGAASGIVTWLAGYAFVFVVAGSNAQDSVAQRFLQAVEGEPTTYEMVGWVFYNAHLVDTVFVNVPVIGEFTTNAIGRGDGLTTVLYLIPIGLLLAAGLAVGRYQRVDSSTAGLLAGLTVVPGYFVLSLIGVLLFEVSVAGATGRPELIDGIVLAGFMYPAAFAGTGGLLAGLIAQ